MPLRACRVEAEQKGAASGKSYAQILMNQDFSGSETEVFITAAVILSATYFVDMRYSTFEG